MRIAGISVLFGLSITTVACTTGDAGTGGMTIDLAFLSPLAVAGQTRRMLAAQCQTVIHDRLQMHGGATSPTQVNGEPTGPPIQDVANG